MTEELIKEATKYIDSRFKQEFFSYWDLLYSIIDVVRPREKRIADLEKENAKLKGENLSNKCDISNLIERVGKAEKENGKARRIIKNIIRVTWGEGWNYSLDFKVEAEDFIKE